MPIRHCVVFRFVEGTTPEQVDEVTRRLRELPDLIPHLRDYQAGPDVGGGDNWDFAVTGEFDSLETFQAYVDHPAHRAVVDEVIAPIRTESARTQFEI